MSHRRKTVISLPVDLLFQMAANQCRTDSIDIEEGHRIVDGLKSSSGDFDLNNITTSKTTALTQCALDGNLKSVKLLIKLGADINKKDGLGWTALHYAANESHLDIVRFLLRNCANPRAMNRKGQMPIEIAEGEEVRALLARVTIFCSPVGKQYLRSQRLPAWI